MNAYNRCKNCCASLITNRERKSGVCLICESIISDSYEFIII